MILLLNIFKYSGYFQNEYLKKKYINLSLINWVAGALVLSRNKIYDDIGVISSDFTLFYWDLRRVCCRWLGVQCYYNEAN